MELPEKVLPVGALPYDNIKQTTAVMARFFKCAPFIPLLPNFSPTESIINRTFENLPGVAFVDDKFVIKVGTAEFRERLSAYENAFNNIEEADINQFGFQAGFLEKYFQMIQKFKPPIAYINLLGPFTFYQLITDIAERQIIADKSYRKLFILAICVKAMSIMQEIKKYSPDTVPVVILEESLLGQFTVMKHKNESLTSEFVIYMLSKVIEKLKKHGAVVGVQCMEKCAWSIPIKAGADLISFDAYNNPNNLDIIPEVIAEFITNGGKINLGIVPVTSSAVVESLNIEYLNKICSMAIDRLALTGLPHDVIKKSLMISLNGDTNNLSSMFAEKVIMLTNQLASRIFIRL